MPKGEGYKHGKASYINKKGKEKVIKPLKKKKRSNMGELGRILEGPEGGRFTSSGRKKQEKN